jgi:hypothetical protein
VQVTRCTASKTIKSAYCGFQSHSGVEGYEKFLNPIVIEPADCRLAAKKGKFKLNKKEYPFEEVSDSQPRRRPLRAGLV